MTKPEYKNVLALDVGSVRIGVAATDALGITAQGITTLNRTYLEKDIQALADLAAERKAQALVVGLPLNMNGTKGQQAEDTQVFAQALAEKCGLPIVYVDERLTTKAAHSALIEGNVRRGDRKKVVDKMAAVLILQSYLGL